MSERQVIEIAGAGPAGLAAALAVHAAGKRAVVSEQRTDVGGRFHGDFQGLENWTTREDVLDELARLGVEATFEHTPVREFVCFTPDGREKQFHSRGTLFYLVRRGNRPGAIDSALKRQALEAGVEIRFNARVRRFPRGGVVTEGPHRADAVATGYLFDTDMADGIYAALAEELAPRGYAYLLVNRGCGTLATCMFADFHNEREHLERSVDFFDRHVGLRMENVRRFGGVGNFSLPRRACKGNILYAGEAAGFQDPLFGFGIRWAVLSGAAAGRALANGNPLEYERFWKKRLRAWHQTAFANRWFYDRLGNRGYNLTVGRFPDASDVRDWIHHAYAPRLWKRLWYHLVAARHIQPLLKTDHECDCTWCRCQRNNAVFPNQPDK